MIDFNGKIILITGGTGTFGEHFVLFLLDQYPDIKKIKIFSRDEFKQHQLKKRLSEKSIPKVQFILGDIRESAPLVTACKGVDYVLHTAALKHVTFGEENPSEFIKTNIVGSENIIQAASVAGVKKVIAMSTDKAVAPLSLYGATKLCADKLFVSASQHSTDTIFSIVRFGNLLGSRGSVLSYFESQSKQGIIHITDERMTRFHIDNNELIQLVLYAFENALGGEIFIPKLPSYKVIDLAKSVAPSASFLVTGVRPGEKIHEELIHVADSINVIESDKYFIVLPSGKKEKKENYTSKTPLKFRSEFSYSSDKNEDWLSSEDFKEILQSEFYKEKEIKL
ncbi:MAG: polysaccharide biosynthesis protein [Cytophagaceae bacterium]|jgi:FlaA1/EpsC-like NDP-sugar epimerase|nr:polysaccharide biosynthesis protein [Cytophagaceae bacterium]